MKKEIVRPVALSQAQYLQKKLNKLDAKLGKLETKHQLTREEIREIYFQKGKLYSELELMKRVPSY